MVFITEDLVRKRAEHNNYELSSLEELSLHQQDIEVIENLDKWCKELKILYLQSNLISKIENVGKLKKLEYLNLALNNITKIENLGNCESLKKLDLTVNFVAELTTIESLKQNHFFSELFLTGNPCTQYEGYREYVIATLPWLKQLDGKEIDKSERIIASQQYAAIRDSILQQQAQCMKSLQKQNESNKANEQNNSKGLWYTDIEDDYKKHQIESDSSRLEDLNEEEREKLYWSEPTAYTPESRIEIHNHIKEQNDIKNKGQKNLIDLNPPARQLKYFKDNGEPLNVNTAKIQFKLNDDDEEEKYLVNVECYKHLETSLIDVDVQPNFVRVVIKDKVLQLALIEEVNPDKSTVQRSATTGHLLIKMPKAAEVIGRRKGKLKTSYENVSTYPNKEIKESSKQLSQEKRVEKESVSLSDLACIVKDNLHKSNRGMTLMQGKSELLEEDFVDDPEVPPLI